MGRVEAFSLSGLDLRFYSLDHGPPHFHAIKTGAWEIRVYFTTCTENLLDFDVKWQKSATGPSAGERKALLQQVLAHRDAILIEWETKVQPA